MRARRSGPYQRYAAQLLVCSNVSGVPDKEHAVVEVRLSKPQSIIPQAGAVSLGFNLHEGRSPLLGNRSSRSTVFWTRPTTPIRRQPLAEKIRSTKSSKSCHVRS